MNENMRRREANERRSVVIEQALSEPWRAADDQGLRALSRFVERLRFIQKKNYAEQSRIFVQRGIGTDERDFESLMWRLDEIQAQNA